MESDASEAPERRLLHEIVYQELRKRLINGRITPHDALSTRSLAAEMGVSQMPVRDALSRLAAEGALLIRSKRRVGMPPMTAERFADLYRCRLALEPEAAVLALPYIDNQTMSRLHEIDQQMDAAISAGDSVGYAEGNAAFHFTIYGCNRMPILNRLIETLWLQFGPYMREVYERYATVEMADQHQIAIEAIGRGDGEALRHAIAEDIADGMNLLRPPQAAAEA